MATDFIGRVIKGKVCPTITIPREIIDLANIKGANDVMISFGEVGGEVSLCSKSDFDKRVKIIGEKSKKDGWR